MHDRNLVKFAAKLVATRMRGGATRQTAISQLAGTSASTVDITFFEVETEDDYQIVFVKASSAGQTMTCYAGRT